MEYWPKKKQEQFCFRRINKQTQEWHQTANLDAWCEVCSRRRWGGGITESDMNRVVTTGWMCSQTRRCVGKQSSDDVIVAEVRRDEALGSTRSEVDGLFDYCWNNSKEVDGRKIRWLRGFCSFEVGMTICGFKQDVNRTNPLNKQLWQPNDRQESIQD